MRRPIAILLPVVMLLLVQLACNQTGSGTVDTQARRDKVIVTQSGGAPQPLPAPGQQSLGVGDGVSVDELGRALLRFGDSLTVEVLRNGDLVMQEVADTDQSFLVTLLQDFGTTFNDFNAPAEIDRRLTISTDQAVIVATGTQFLVVREGKTPLDWVIALRAGQDDLTVTAGGVTKAVPAGTARWVGPEGEPSEAIPFDEPAVQSWLESLRQGLEQPEVGEVVWEQADLLANTEPVRAIGDRFVLQGVPITPDPEGLFGNPEYWLEDCNQDGVVDVAMRGGRLWMDLRAVPARVRALDVTVLNRGAPGDGALRAFDPARKPLATDRLAAGQGQLDVLSLRTESGEPIHYGELGLVDGCFLGFSLTPEQRDGDPGQPRPAVEMQPPISLRFTAEPDRLLAGQCTELRWQVENAETVYLNGEPVEAAGSAERCLKATTAFTLRAEAGDQAAEESVTVVAEVPPAISANLTVEPTEIPYGECAIVTWEVKNAEEVTLNGQLVRAGGEQKACPTENTKFVLRAAGLAGTVERTAGLIVQPPPAIEIEFGADPATIDYGAEATLYWQVVNADKVTLDGRPVEFAGQEVVNPDKTTRFVLVAEGPAGSVERTATLEVREPPEPVAEFWADRTAVTPADCAVVLNWETFNAEEAFLNGEAVRLKGSWKDCPQESQVYTLRVVGAAGLENSYELTVAVETLGTPASFLGTWVSTDEKPELWTRLAISQDEGDWLLIEPFLVCDTGECAFDAIPGRIEEGQLVAEYQQRSFRLGLTLWREGDLLQARTRRESTLRTAAPVEVTGTFRRPRLILPSDRLILPERLLPVQPGFPLQGTPTPLPIP